MLDVTQVNDLGALAILFLVLDRIFTFVKPYLPSGKSNSAGGDGTAGNANGHGKSGDQSVYYWRNVLTEVIGAHAKPQTDILARIEVSISKAVTLLEERR